MTDDQTKPLPLIFVPLGPIITPLLALWCAMLDISIILSHALTHGRYPSLEKVIVCTAITLSLNAYCLWTARQHKVCREAFQAILKERLGQPAITIRQAAMVVGAVMFFSILGAWAFFFTS